MMFYSLIPVYFWMVYYNTIRYFIVLKMYFFEVEVSVTCFIIVSQVLVVIIHHPGLQPHLAVEVHNIFD